MAQSEASGRADVRKALGSLGFRIEDQPPGKGDVRPDMLARRGASSYIVEVKIQSAFREAQFEGAVAHGILALRALRSRGLRGKPLLAIRVERAKPNAASVFQAFLGQHAPDFDWLIVDASGWRRWKIGRDQGEAEGAARERSESHHAQSVKSHPFAPRHQWMLKILLLPGLDRRYWGGPEQPPGTVSALAAASGAAKSHAWNLVALLDQRGYLRHEGGRFHFPGLRRLLDDWSAHVRLRPDRSVGAALVYPERSAEKAVSRILSDLSRPSRAVAEPQPGQVVVGGHRACELLGLGRSNIRALHLYADNLDAALKRLDLVPAEAGAVLEVAQPKARESVFRACVRVKGLPVADVLQLYLDLRGSPARGVEQSEFLFERVLEPHFKAAGWL